MPYPDRILADDEEVVAHLHPHWLTVFWPIVWFLLLVGGASFGCAVVPAGPDQGVVRLVVVGAALVLGLFLVGRPLLRWRTTHYVVTTHRLLQRTGVLSRTGRDVGLSRITDVSYRQRLWERLFGSGTVAVETAGEGGPTLLTRIPDSQGVQQLIAQLVEEDAERRAQAGWGAGHGWGGARDDGGWADDGWDGPDEDHADEGGRRRRRGGRRAR